MCLSVSVCDVLGIVMNIVRRREGIIIPREHSLHPSPCLTEMRAVAGSGRRGEMVA